MAAAADRPVFILAAPPALTAVAAAARDRALDAVTAPGVAAMSGIACWLAARRAVPAGRYRLILDCDDAPGYAAAALDARLDGLRLDGAVLDGSTPAFAAIEAQAATAGQVLLTPADLLTCPGGPCDLTATDDPSAAIAAHLARIDRS